MVGYKCLFNLISGFVESQGDLDLAHARRSYARHCPCITHATQGNYNAKRGGRKEGERWKGVSELY